MTARSHSRDRQKEKKRRAKTHRNTGEHRSKKFPFWEHDDGPDGRDGGGGVPPKAARRRITARFDPEFQRIITSPSGVHHAGWESGYTARFG